MGALIERVKGVFYSQCPKEGPFADLFIAKSNPIKDITILEDL